MRNDADAILQKNGDLMNAILSSKMGGRRLEAYCVKPPRLPCHICVECVDHKEEPFTIAKSLRQALMGVEAIRPVD